jgi:uncharacterized protein (TIGR00645 family)
MEHNEVKNKPTAVRIVEAIVFNVKWVLPIFYLGLIVIMGLYAFTYAKDIWHLVTEAGGFTVEAMELTILEMVDIVMVANLVKMIIAGSYNSFISKDHGFPNENISSGMLKLKISTSIVLVSSIHLLQTFVSVNDASWDKIYKQLVIHGSFLVGSAVLGMLEYLHVKSEVMEHGIKNSQSH